jgi:hypothetical protein
VIINMYLPTSDFLEVDARDFHFVFNDDVFSPPIMLLNDMSDSKQLYTLRGALPCPLAPKLGRAVVPHTPYQKPFFP